MQSFRTCGGVSLDTSNIQALFEDLFKGNASTEAEEPSVTSKPQPHTKDRAPRLPWQRRSPTSTASSMAQPEARAGGIAFMTSPSSNELVHLSDDSEEEDTCDEQLPNCETQAEKWVRKITPPRARSMLGHGARRKRSGPQASSSHPMHPTNSSAVSMYPKSRYPPTLAFRGTSTPNNECKIEVQSTELSGSPNSEFRDAHVTFEEDQCIVDLVDKKGRTWRLISTVFPGAGIDTLESRYNLDANGKEMNITLKKAQTTDSWEEQHIFLRPQVFEADKAAGGSPTPTAVNAKASLKTETTSTSASSPTLGHTPLALGSNFLLM